MSRRERRDLQKKLRAMEWQIWDMEVMFNMGAPGATVYPWGREQRRQISNLIEQYDSREIEKQAEKFGIEIPIKPDWFSTEIKHVDPDNLESDTVTDRWLNETGRRMITKQIRHTRFAYWKGWADLLIPILALVVAVLALFKDIIVEVLKKHS